MMPELERSEYAGNGKPKKRGRARSVSTVLAEAMPKFRKTRAKTPGATVTIDFPLNGEQIQPGHYAVRIGADGGTAVDLSIDGQDWQPCRPSAGYFWYDWTDIPAGKYRLAARVRLPDGDFKTSKIVRCAV
ncbi:MAG: hypothetical protein A2902_06450 [Elusimicrobia bacterium RIFCSPLOWO2_01_FULL_64_13]|nr:MAG: hypothetical protein A2636_06960 [Elusimicrobia bacterium RIFCSPHIGHO2_01_FULL_64_10]OGR96419.1 MAG: hypothetical protein A2902_06450 [Elusimicrobia bacterium RIFCSPLOWO2_01_FULL_64_13]